MNLSHAKHAIDLIELLQEKTKGNCTDHEEAILENLLHELRIAYIALQSGSATTEIKVARPQQRLKWLGHNRE